MNPVCVDIVDLLAGVPLGVKAVDLFALEWDVDVDAQTLIIDTSGRDSALKEVFENPTFQVLVRGAKGDDLLTAYNVIKAVHDFLIVQLTQEINSVEYLQFEPIGTIAGLGRDKNDRGVYSMNYYTFRDPI